ncbi:hypothetical protein [Streptomyces sp. NPDC051162]|uniref:hypothetical protein n=1 Tax=Streptomyces sp. NPDC051162 TaxID=3154747 RepID=UPI00342AD69D
MLQLDADSAAHIAAMRATLAHAAKVAQDAQTNAAYANKVAAEARKSADDALKWADAATKSAAKAQSYKDQAAANADAADKSAKDAQASADKAKNAALTARGAARRANYSANQATAAAAAAVQSAISAQSSANSALASATQAGKDAKAAAQAASEAKQIAATKRQQEQAEAARKAAEAARKAKQEGVDQSDSADNDKTKTPSEFLGLDKDGWKNVANRLGTVSTVTGSVAALGLVVPPPCGEVIYGAVGAVSLVTGVASAVITGFTDGWTSNAFLTSAFGVAIGIATTGLPFGKFTGTVGYVSKAFEGIEGGVFSAGVQAQRLGSSLLSPAVGAITSVGDAISDAWHDLTPW